ncbi:hypothetical protein PR048_002669 [Dryococelus australis]|uniref:Dehydrogenase/reductase SDR family member 11 n=1 Tax=Dryococelus australis TaxID=614101 RepID=A0ABQ9IN76_9NEOP|nr:hypothetical protein PR048_002669 [Dryococelus australis]
MNVPGLAMYTATKHAVTALTEGLRKELTQLKSKIRITSISPGAVDTQIAVATGIPEEILKMVKNRPMMESKDVTNALI